MSTRHPGCRAACIRQAGRSPVGPRAGESWGFPRPFFRDLSSDLPRGFSKWGLGSSGRSSGGPTVSHPRSPSRLVGSLPFRGFRGLPTSPWVGPHRRRASVC